MLEVHSRRTQSAPTTEEEAETRARFAAFQRGEERALAVLLEEARPWLTVRSARWLRGANWLRCVSPEDLVQDGLMRAYRKHGSFRGQTLGSFRAWLVRITHNRLLDIMKVSGRESDLLQDPNGPFQEAEPGAVRPPVPPPESRLLAFERRTEIFAGLRTLTRDERLVLVLKEILELPWETTQALLHRPTLKAARSFHARAKHKLSERLSPGLRASYR